MLCGSNFISTCDRFATQNFIGFFQTLSLALMILNIFPLVSFGYGKQVEAPNIVYWVSQALCGLIIFFNTERKLLLLHLREPLVFGCFMLALTSFGLSFFHHNPLMSWIGAMQMGEGGFLFLALGIQILTFRLYPFTTQFFTRCVLILGIFFCGLSLTGNNEPIFFFNHYIGRPLGIIIPHHDHAAWWAPYWFPDFVAFLILPLMTIYGLYLNTLRTWEKAIYGSLLILFMLFSCNSIFKYGFLLSAIAVSFFYFLSNIPLKKHTASLIITGAVGMTLIAYFSDDLHFLPLSIQQRALLLKVTTTHYFHNITFQNICEFFIGRGWGSFNTFLSENVYLLDVSAYTGANLNLSWESLVRDQFHTHNIIFEYWISLGIVGLILLAFFAYHIMKSLKEEYFYVGIFYFTNLVILSCFWFQNTPTLPYNILALVFLLNHKPLQNAWVPSMTSILVKILPFLCILMLTISLIQGYASQYILHNHNGQSAKTDIQDMKDFSKTSWAKLDKYQDFYRTNNYCIHHLAIVDKALEHKKAKLKKIFEINKIRAQFILDNVDHNTFGAARIVATNLLGINVLNPRLKKYATNEDWALWERSIQEVIHYLPYRGDIAIPLLSSYMTAGKFDKAMVLIDLIRAHHPENAAALWFRGMLLLQNGSTQREGIANAYQALEQGVNRFMPMDENQVQRIQALHEGGLP